MDNNTNKQIQFWLGVGSFITFIIVFAFMLVMAILEEVTIVFKKEYCLLLIPALFYFMFQFIFNYINLIEEKDDRH